MSCQHEGRRPYKLYLGHRTTSLCQSCHDLLVNQTGMVLTPIERRVEDVRPAVERRHSRVPQWLRNLTARDETGRSLAA